MKLASVVCVVACTAALTVNAQQTHSHGASAPPQPPATLRTGLGSYHHAITTTSPEAQKYFDQGLTLVFGFNHGGAIRMFRRASELDPSAAMPLWGIALALGPHINNPDVDADAEKQAAETAYTPGWVPSRRASSSSRLASASASPRSIRRVR